MKDGVGMEEDLTSSMEKIPPEVRAMWDEGFEISRALVMELRESDLSDIWSYVSYLHSMFDAVIDEIKKCSGDDAKELIKSAYANWALEHAILTILLPEEFCQKVQLQRDEIMTFYEKRKKIMASNQAS